MLAPRNYYDYENNIHIVTTPNGDKAITMNEEILTEIENYLYDVSKHYKANNHEAAGRRVLRLWEALIDKDN